MAKNLILGASILEFVKDINVLVDYYGRDFCLDEGEENIYNDNGDIALNADQKYDLRKFSDLIEIDDSGILCTFKQGYYKWLELRDIVVYVVKVPKEDKEAFLKALKDGFPNKVKVQEA